MGFVDAIRTVLSKYAVFSGRASRSEFWWWFLAYLIIVFIAALLDGLLIIPILGTESAMRIGGLPLTMIAHLGLLLPNLAVAIRRLHDQDKSGWWILIVLVPLIGTFILLYFYIRRGTDGENRFGPAIV